MQPLDPSPVPIFLDHKEQPRKLGCLPPKPDFGGFPKFSEGYPLIPESKWEEVDFSGYNVPIMNQGQESGCVWHAQASAFWRSWLISGATPVEFSPTFGYAIGNGGQDNGMIISDALTIAMTYGNCLASQFPEGQIWQKDIPADAYETAKLYKITDAYHADSFEAIATGILNGFIPVYGIYVGNGFNNLDPAGIPPAYSGRQGNHCLNGKGLIKVVNGASRYYGQWVIPTVNSWGDDWGFDGCCNLSRDFFNSSCDAFLIRAVSQAPASDKTEIPVAAVA